MKKINLYDVLIDKSSNEVLAIDPQDAIIRVVEVKGVSNNSSLAVHERNIPRYPMDDLDDKLAGFSQADLHKRFYYINGEAFIRNPGKPNHCKIAGYEHKSSKSFIVNLSGGGGNPQANKRAMRRQLGFFLYHGGVPSEGKIYLRDKDKNNNRIANLSWNNPNKSGKAKQRRDPSYKKHKHELYIKQGGAIGQLAMCAGCYVRYMEKDLHIDHIRPDVDGGGNDIENLQLLCANCNSRKGKGTMAELRESLRRDGLMPMLPPAQVETAQTPARQAKPAARSELVKKHRAIWTASPASRRNDKAARAERDALIMAAYADGLRQQDLSNIYGLNPGHISRIVNNPAEQTPDPASAVLISKHKQRWAASPARGQSTPDAKAVRDALIVDAKADGLNDRHLANIYGLSAGGIYTILKKRRAANE